jgi:hypothetical protein
MPDQTPHLTEARAGEPIYNHVVRLFIIGAVIFALLCIFPVVAVRGAGLLAGAMAKNLEGGEKIAMLALSALATAKVTPHLPLCAVNATACAAVATASRAVGSKAAKWLIAIFAVLAAIASAAASLWMCRINGVPLRVFVSILTDLFDSRIL